MIDNSDNGYWHRIAQYGKVLFDGYRPEKRMSCNESWNYGISKLDDDCDLVSILNDDILLNRYFFEKVVFTFKRFKYAGVVCPFTVNDRRDMQYFTKNGSIFQKMTKREGWAFTIKKSLLDQIPPIPAQLKTFCGDDWFWHYTHKKGLFWYKHIGNCIFHHVGAAVRKLGVRKNMNAEKRIFRGIIRGL